jgi:hypothetical protein
MKKTALGLALIGILIFYGCEKQSDSASAGSGGTGTGGSMARFTIVGNYLYLADHYNLNVYKITNGAAPIFIKTLFVGNNVETLYPYNNQLFIGSQFGMYIYSLADPENPSKLGQATHVRACDPVVAKDSFAFVTLKGNTPCGSTTNALYTYNIKNMMSPISLDTLALPTPAGLGYKDTTLFVCCESSGLAIINIKDPKNPSVKKYINSNSFYDVIPLGNTLVCMVKTGIDLYDISDVNNVQLIKSIGN